MPYVSKPDDWDVLSIPPIQPIQYYSILKKRREFSQLIKNYDAQVFKHGCMHYCCIVPKSISFCLSSKCEIIISFLNEILNVSSFIGFRVIASKETFLHESNLLLLFLKKSNKAIFYLKDNNYIHVQCEKSDAWELFYLLYNEYLRRYMLTVIGTQFFYSFVYSYIIKKEKQLLEMLYKGSKIIRVSRKSIYYKIHRKRKISVTDLIHMTYNMPKTKKYAVSCYNFKKRTFHLRYKKKPYTSGKARKLVNNTREGEKEFQNVLYEEARTSSTLFEERSVPSDSVCYVHSESLVSVEEESHVHKSEKQFHQILPYKSLKRKFQETECTEDKFLHSSSAFKIFKLSESSTIGDEWRKLSHTDFKPYAIENYSNIPCLQHVVPKILKFSGQKNFQLMKILEDRSHSIFTEDKIFPYASTATKMDIGDPLTVKSTFGICNLTLPTSSVNISSRQCTSAYLRDMQENCIQEKKDKSKIFSSGSLMYQSNKHPKNLFNIKSFEHSTKNINVDLHAASVQNKDYFDSVNNEETLFKASDIGVQRSKTHKNINSFKDVSCVLKKKAVIEEKFETNVSEVDPSLERKINNEKLNTLSLFDKAENFRQGYFDSFGDVSFTTATGKDIMVSNNAIQTVQKLIQGIFTEEKILDETPAPGTSKSKRIVDTAQDIGCSSKKSRNEDIDIDETLVEKFFEDSPFDETELETIVAYNKDTNSSLTAEQNSDQKLVTHKVKKSLGGRRSLKFSNRL